MTYLKIASAILFLFGFIIMLGIGSLYLYPTAFKPLIEEQFSEVLGREVIVKGDVYIGVGIRPKIIVKDVEIKPLPRFKSRQVERIDRIEIKLLLVKLLTGKLNIYQIKMRGGNIVIVKRGKKILNWQLGRSKKAKATGQGLTTLKILKIENFNIHYRVQGKTQAYHIDKLTLRKGWGREFNLDIALVSKKIPLKVKANLSGLNRLPRDYARFNIKMSAPRNNLNIKGRFNGEYKNRWFESTYSINGDNVKGPSALFNIFIPDISPYNITGNVTATRSIYTTTMDGKAAGGTIKGKISIDGSTQNLSSDIDVDAAGIEADKFIHSFGAMDDLRGGKINIDFNVKDVHLGGEKMFVPASGPVNLLITRSKYKKDASIMEFSRSESLLSEVTCFLGQFTLGDGKAKAHAIAIDTPSVSVVGKGNINLTNNALDLKMHPLSKGPASAFMNVDIKVTGTIDEPQITIEKLSAIKSALKTTVSIITLGALMQIKIATLGSFGGVTGKQNPCYKALTEREL